MKRNHAEEECGNPEDATGWDAGLRPVDVNAADGAEGVLAARAGAGAGRVGRFRRRTAQRPGKHGDSLALISKFT